MRPAWLALVLLSSCVGVAATRAPARPRQAETDDKPWCVKLPAKANRVTVFHGGHVFDGERIVEETQIIVVDGVIENLTADRCVDAGGALLDDVDLRGATIMPGLIDSHVHAGDGDEALAQALAFGVTTVIDMFGPPARIRQLRAMDLAGETTNLADLYGAGVLATAPGGHGTEYGIPIPTVASVADAAPFVDDRFREGSDFLKVIVDTSPEANPKDPIMPTLSRDVVAALTNAAHARGKLVVAHVAMKKDAEDVVAAGVDGLAHVFADEEADDALLDAIQKKKIFVIPTLSMKEMHCGIATGKPLLGDARITPLLGEAAKKHLERFYKWAKPLGGSPEACMSRPFATMRTLRSRTAILAGTDAPNGGTTFGASLHRELELLVESGLTPREALAAATSAPARALRLTDRGTIAVGKRADLVIVEGDPTSDIVAARSIRAIYKKGIRVDRWAAAEVAARKPKKD